MYTPTRAPSSASRRPPSSSTPRSTSQVAFGRSKSSLGERNRFPSRQISSSGSAQLNAQNQSRSISRKSSLSSIDSRRVSSSSMGVLSSGNQSSQSILPKLNIKVSIRPRPFDSTKECPWIIDEHNNEILNDDIGIFNYDHVFSQNDEDEKVYNIVADPVINDCLNGFSGTIFAYGMTGSGKTHSMKAVVERSVNTLFNSNGLNPPKTPVKQDWMINSDVFKQNNYKVKHISVSILEIYNEKLVDLLNNDKPLVANNNLNNGRRSSLMPSRNPPEQQKVINDLRIVDDPKFGIKILNLTEIKTTNREQLMELIEKGESSRKIDSTDYNERSSRSHLIIQLKVALIDGNLDEIVSLLNFCDLAGSERSTTKNDRRKEGAYINKSLLALGTVIMKLSQISSGGGSSSSVESSANHIPYRDSKLTRILQPSLSGGSIVSILCTIHLGSNVVGETTNTLRFGLRAKNVLLSVKKSEIGLTNDMMSLLRENERLFEEVNHLKMVIDSQAGGLCSSPFSDIGVSPITVSGRNSSFGNRDNEKFHEIVAENVVLSEQVEHLKRLQSTREEGGIKSTDMNMELLQQQIRALKDPSLRKRFEIVCESLKGDLANERYKTEELTSYVSHLENKVRMLEIELDSLRHEEDVLTLVSNGGATLRNVSELEESIKELRVSIERKDAMIGALQSASRLQNTVNKSS